MDKTLNAVSLSKIPVLNAANAVWEKDMRFGVSAYKGLGSNSDSAKLHQLFKSSENNCL